MLYNEKERNAKNINIAFDSRQLFDSYKRFMDPRHAHQNFREQCHPHYPRQNFNPSHFFWLMSKFYEPRTHAPTLLTQPTVSTPFSRLKKNNCLQTLFLGLSVSGETSHLGETPHLNEIPFISCLHEKNIPLVWYTFHPIYPAFLFLSSYVTFIVYFFFVFISISNY